MFCTPPASQSINSSFLSLWEWERKERIDLIEGVWRPQGNEWVKKWNGWTVSFAAAALSALLFLWFGVVSLLWVSGGSCRTAPQQRKRANPNKPKGRKRPPQSINSIQWKEKKLLFSIELMSWFDWLKRENGQLDSSLWWVIGGSPP